MPLRPRLLRRRVRPLSVYLGVMVVSLLLVVALSLVLFTYLQGRHLAHLMALEEMRVAGERIGTEFDHLLDAPEMVTVMASVSGLDLVADADRIAFAQEALDQLPQIDSIYIGRSDGSFSQGVALDEPGSAWRKVTGAPSDAAYAFRRIHQDPVRGRVQSWRFRDAQGQTVADAPPSPSDFDPRTRGWFKEAQHQAAPVLSPPYRMASTGDLGVTISRRLVEDPSVVVGTDVLLETLGHFLQDRRISDHARAYLFDPDGVLMAHSDPKVMGLIGANLDGVQASSSLQAADPMLPIVQARLTRKAANPTNEVAFEEEPWLIEVVPSVGQDMLARYAVVVAAPLSDFTAPSERLARNGLLISAAVIALGVCVAVLVAWRLGRSLTGLTDAARRLGDLDFQPRPVVGSRVLEITTLSQALTAARHAIQTFALYVPREIVSRIVESAGIHRRFGRRQEVTVLFTDIRDFTTICESNDPEDVVEMLSAYFDLLSAGVYAHGGAIIQFLGDSIFASWNAPTPDPAHVDHACACALDLAERIQAFNLAQAAAGRPVFITRLGLHTGHAVMGSVGSTNRLQYTGMGDTVNVASRLEGLNKQFGTTILVSEAVRKGCRQDFRFRSLGEVPLKGRLERLEVHELVADPPSGPGGTAVVEHGFQREPSTGREASGRHQQV
ncbi:adenylate/guanylate cyclase domain-containing protein [Geminicoccus roseus]|uniref:adenylate/guanylate cyclase domain-containing protein n=1 Tax=Geminicoccus roseus TaxID=404900 RepID=UPI0012F9E1CD|nr:adenylate/guanylate cyclase domain-containing protein [Geminicoccus roseus]